MSPVLAFVVARGIVDGGALGAASLTPEAIAWWFAPVALAAVAAMLLLEPGRGMPEGHRYRRVAERATTPLLAFMGGLILVGAWTVSHIIVSVIAVTGMVLVEFGKSLPGEHRYRQLADRATFPLVAVAVAVILLSGWRLAEIIGFVQ
jgi:hypothetical protein